MSETNSNSNNHENPTSVQIGDFFEDYDPTNESAVESIDESTEEEIETEIIASSVSINDSNNFIEHEEFRLKVLEFKLKKKTHLKDSHSKFKDKKNERRLRKENAKKAFWFSSIWAVFIACFILLHGFKGLKLPFLTDFIEIKFEISETEFMFVCGTLTASILIFYLTVIKNLFPNKIEEKQSSEN